MSFIILSDTQLKKLNTKRLIGVLKSARAVEQSERNNRISQGWCCEICKEWTLGEEQWILQVVKPTAHLTAYKNQIKKILANREHIQ